jgi:hypothetical protein
LINNLDLRVRAPDGKVYHGNGGSGADTKNNVETVRIERPAPGRYTVIVDASRVNALFGSQPFALVGTVGQSFGGIPGVIEGGATVYLPLIIHR